MIASDSRKLGQYHNDTFMHMYMFDSDVNVKASENVHRIPIYNFFDQQVLKMTVWKVDHSGSLPQYSQKQLQNNNQRKSQSKRLNQCTAFSAKNTLDIYCIIRNKDNISDSVALFSSVFIYPFHEWIIFLY